MTNGILSIKHRKSLDESKEVSGQQRRRPSYRVFVKGKNYVPKQVTLHLVANSSWGQLSVTWCGLLSDYYHWLNIYKTTRSNCLTVAKALYSAQLLYKAYETCSFFLTIVKSFFGSPFVYRMIISSVSQWNSIWPNTTSNSRNLMYRRLWILLWRYYITCTYNISNNVKSVSFLLVSKVSVKQWHKNIKKGILLFINIQKYCIIYRHGQDGESQRSQLLL